MSWRARKELSTRRRCQLSQRWSDSFLKFQARNFPTSRLTLDATSLPASANTQRAGICRRLRTAATASPTAPKAAKSQVDGSGVGIEFCTLISPAEGILRRQ